MPGEVALRSSASPRYRPAAAGAGPGR